MSTNDNSGDNPQPQGESPQPEAFNVDNILSELTAEFEAQQSTEEPPELGKAPAVEESPAESKEPETKEILSPLLAEKSRREREARAEIEALKGSTEQAIKQAQADLLAELKSNPQGFIAKYGIDNAGDLAMHFYAADLGDDAPDDLKAQIGMSDLERYKAEQAKELQAIRDEFAHREVLARNQAVIDQYDGFLSEVPAELPYLQVEAKHDQREVLSTMAQVADHLFQQNGQYPSAIEVAKLIEREISTQAARYSAIGKQDPNVELSQTEPVEKESFTLSTDLSKSSPKAKPVGEDDLFEDALKYYKEELMGK